jgi:long-chain acyl-CoA synthetase
MSDITVNTDTQMEPHFSKQSANVDEAFVVTHPWIRHYEQGVPAHIEIPDQPLTWLLDRTASRYPDRTALIYFGTRLSYAQLAHHAHRFAFALQFMGVKKGDRVAIALNNIPQFPMAFYGALLAGAVVVPTNPLYTEREMQHQLADSGARVLVMLDMFYPIVRAVRQQTALEHIIFTSPADFMPPVLHALYLLSQRRARSPEPQLTHQELHDDHTLHVMNTMLESHTGDGRAVFTSPEPVQASDLAMLLYTGGTTGLSKGAMLTHRNMLANAMQAWAWYPQAREGEEVMLCQAPFFHAYGLTVGMNCSLLAAASMILIPRFKAQEVVKAIRRYHPTIFPGIPTMYLAVMNEAGKHPDDLRSIKYCISGGAPLPAQVQAEFEALTGGRLVEGYGLSEASPVTHCNPLTEKSRTGSIGLPLPGVEAAIVNQATGEPVPIGEVGELVVKGPNIMQGYWNRPEETSQAFHNGWMRTGDLGKMDADGYFSIVERVKDVIIASGFKVYPREVEEVLFKHPAVAEAAVAGVADPYRGETVAAFIVLKPGIEASDETKWELLQYCKQELTAYKVPTILEFRQSLPKSLVGKVLRRALRAGV